MKRTIEIDDTLEDITSEAIDLVKDEFTRFCDENIPDECPEMGDDFWPCGWKAAAIYSYIEQEVNSWFYDNAEDYFAEWARQKVADNIRLIVSDSIGIYIPKYFADDEFLSDAYGLSDDEKAILSNPDHDNYWDVWDEITTNNTRFDADTKTEYRLYQDGNLWEVPTDFDGIFSFWAE